MVGLWILALVAHGAEQPEPTASGNHGVVLWLGGAVEPVQVHPNGISGGVSAQVWLADRIGLEWSTNLYSRKTTSPLTQPLFVPSPLWHPPFGRISNPTASTDLRLQFAFVDGTVATRRGDLPVSMTLDLGGGLVATRDDLRVLQCAPIVGHPCTQSVSQLHPTAVLGTGLGIAPSNRLRLRGTVGYRTWVENFDGVGLERMGSVTMGLDIGFRLGPTGARVNP